MVCKNCAHTFEGLYCYHCGQAAATSRITTREILTDVIFSVVKVNRGFLFTARELCRRPGEAVRNYLAGQRVVYYAPHKYLFFAGAVATFLTARYHSFAGQYASVDGFEGDIHAFFGAFFAYADAYGTLINIITIPVFALASFLVFRRSGYNYAEHLVLNTYITAQQLLLFIVWLPVTRFFPASANWPFGLYVSVTLLYNLWVYTQFCGSGTVASLFRSVAAMGLAYAGQLLLNLAFFYLWQTYL